uniref:Uncharacterized protein n=1 Tax=Anguilla anguilla TaxID=7936 RepID=A0A0E9U056_ANGAN
MSSPPILADFTRLHKSSGLSALHTLSLKCCITADFLIR